MTQNSRYDSMSRGELINALEAHDHTLQAIYSTIHLPNEKMAPGEKLFWIGARCVLAGEKPNTDGLVRLPTDDIADFIGMSESSTGRYANAVIERYDATKVPVPYTTKKGQERTLTYVDRTDPVWREPWNVDVPEEKERTINGNGKYCERCHTYNLQVTTRRLTYQEIQECDCCGYKKVSKILDDKSPLDPGEYLPDKKGLQAGEPFGDPQEQEQEQEAKAQNDASLTVYTCAASDALPAHLELQAIPQWVCWRAEERNGKLTKVPYNARSGAVGKASVTDPATWATYEQAQALYERSQSWGRPYAGVGFVFHKNGIVGIDQDGQLQARIPSYTELSFSENGLHTFAHGAIASGRRRNGIEMYDTGRFFAWTGKHVPGTPGAIIECQEAIDALYQELAPPVVEMPTHAPPQNVSYSHTDAEVLEKARNGANGAKFCALYDQGTFTGYRSQSEADLALCKMLAYWSDNDVSTVKRLFPQSRLMREKWNRNVGNGETYGERTIRIAMSGRERQAS